MKIAISATGADLEAEVDPRFGRCSYFIIVDPDTMKFESFENPSVAAGGGAGISTAQIIAGKGVQVVLTGNCGPNAYQVLSAAGVKVIIGVSGKVGDAIQDYKAGRLKASSQPNVAAHSGMGRGKWGGMGHGMGLGAVSPPASLEQELDVLRSQSQALAQQLAEIQRRIEELEKKGK